MGLTERLDAAFRQRCEAISLEVRLALGVRAFDRLPADTLAAHLGAALLTPDQFGDLPLATLLIESETWSAAIITQHPLQILLNPRHAPARRESDLMHECAHVLLGHEMAAFDTRSGLPLRRARDEDEAVYLGGCLQIPRRGLLWAAQTNRTLAQTVAHFGASEAMTRFRCRVTGQPLREEESDG